MRQLMVARVFPAYHPRAGEPTMFVEKIWESIYIKNSFSEVFDDLLIADVFDIAQHGKYAPKHHTIRAGKHWPDGKLRQTGDKVNLKGWKELPYRSKTITITPPLELTVYDIEISATQAVFVDADYMGILRDCLLLAKNDGLYPQDMTNWFIPNPAKFTGFSGQILVWGDVKY